LVYRRRCFLVSREDAVELIQETPGQFTVLCDAVEDKVYRGLLISKDVNQVRWRNVCTAVGNDIFSKPLRY
jgi:hypothetical protein